MQFTRNRKINLLLELPLCRKTLEKKFPFAMWPLGGRPAQVEHNSGEARRSLAGGGWGSDLGPLGFGLVGRTGAERLRRAGTPAAREGGRRGCRSR
jgi:hypothetical protein